MTLDQYQPCPGGLDKKIKFCCKDLVSDLDKITRSFDGEQYEAALQHIDRLLPKHRDRQCLWAMKSSVLMQTGKLEEAKNAIDEFLRIAPENPIALANCAVLQMAILSGAADDATEEEVGRLGREQEQAAQEAVATLHQALEHCGTLMPHEVFQAAGFLGQLLIEMGHIQSGREHLLFQYALGGDEAKDAVRTLLETGNSPHVPLPLKQETYLPAPVDWVQWKEGYIAARELASRGAWTPAAEEVTRLIAEYEPHPVLLRAQATLRCRLPNPERAATALRQLAASDDIPLDEAVEAEALAQILDPPDPGNVVDLISATFTVNQADSLQERMLASRQTQALPVDGVSPPKEGPPAKAAFRVLDRDLPTSADQLALETLPEVLADCFLFGKQTDREARLEVLTLRTRLEEVHRKLREIAGETLAADSEETLIVAQVPEGLSQLSVRPQFPPRTPYEETTRLVNERRQRVFQERWPHLAEPALDHLTPAEVAGDPKYQKRLLGTMLRLELTESFGHQAIDWLREELNLPAPQPIDVEGDEAQRIPLVRLRRLDATRLNDHDLAVCFLRASQANCRVALLKLGRELVGRESAAATANLADVYGRMAQAADDLTEALELLHQAQAAAVKNGQSPATWLVPELSIRMVAGQSAEAQQLLNRIQSRHIREPGIAQLLMQTLQRLGVVTPDGQPVAPRPAEPGAGATAANAPQKLWTPEGDAASAPPQAAEEEPGKSQLWIPGMD